MRRMTVGMFVAVLGLAAAPAAPARPARWAPCLTVWRASGCGALRGLRDSGWGLVAPGGRTLYIVDGAQVAVVARDRRTGKVRQLAGRAGCVELPAGRCRAGTGSEIARLAASADGRTLYALVQDGQGRSARTAVYALRRDPRSGRLHGAADCLSTRAWPGCRRLRLPGRWRALISIATGARPDRLYLAAGAVFGAASAQGTDIVLGLSRDRAGRMRRLRGRSGCVGAAAGCRPAPGLQNYTTLVAAPDGDTVYGVSRYDLERSGAPLYAVVDLAREAGGRLRERGCLQADLNSGGPPVWPPREPGCDIVSDLPDDGPPLAVGRDLYLGPLHFRQTPALRYVGCWTVWEDPRCDPITRGFVPQAVSGDGRALYTAYGSIDGGVLQRLDRDPGTGAITVPADSSGCVIEGVLGLPGPSCRRGRLLLNARFALVAGRDVYVFSARARRQGQDCCYPSLVRVEGR